MLWRIVKVNCSTSLLLYFQVAIKTIKKSKIETEQDAIRIRREIQIMSSIRHPNIVHIYEVFENKDKIVLVMQNASGGELYEFLNERKVLNDAEARRIFRQVVAAVYYIHKYKICHRDLKLENILLDEKGNAKVSINAGRPNSIFRYAEKSHSMNVRTPNLAMEKYGLPDMG